MSGEGLIAEPRAIHASEGHARLHELMHRGTEFLGCDVAVMIKAPFADLATFYQGEQRVGSWPTLAGRGALC